MTCTMAEANGKQRTNIGKFAGAAGILCNLVLAGGKLAAGQLSGSMSVTADGVNNLSDAAGSIVTLMGFRLAERPADRKHPYGHARYEYMAGLMVAVMILAVGLELVKDSLKKIICPDAVTYSSFFLIILAISMFVKAGMMIFYRKTGETINSGTLLAAAQDSRNDMLTTAAIMAASLIGRQTGWRIDGMMSLLVSLFILWDGFRLVRETASPLLGEGAKPDFRRALTAYIGTFPKVLGCHDLIVHDYGPNQTYASIHLEFDKDENLMECHEIIDRIERRCREMYATHLVIHLDPVVTDDARLYRTRRVVERWLREKDSRLTIHDFRLYDYGEKIRLVFDMILPEEPEGTKEALKEELERFLNQEKDLPEGTYYQLDITFDPEMEE